MESYCPEEAEHKYQPDFNDILGLLINELAGIHNPFCLILDDYHLIRNPAIHTSLTFLLEHIP